MIKNDKRFYHRPCSPARAGNENNFAVFRVCALPELAGRCRRRCVGLRIQKPYRSSEVSRLRGGVARPLSDPEVPSSTSSPPQNSCIFWIIISSQRNREIVRVRCLPSSITGHKLQWARGSSFDIRYPYSSAIKRDLYGATITFTLRVLECISRGRRQFYCGGIMRNESENLDAACEYVYIIAAALRGLFALAVILHRAFIMQTRVYV